MKEKNLQKFANFGNLQKIALFSKIFYVFLFFTLQIFYNIFCNFQTFTPKEIFAFKKFFFCKNKIFYSIPIEVFLQCFVENLADFEL